MDRNNTAKHSVIDALDKTRQEHPHPPPADHTPLSHVRKDITDETIEQSEAIHIPTPNNTASSPADKERLIGLSTTATLPSTTWEPLSYKSSNKLSSSAPTTISQHGHDKPSVLPEIMPGFKDRMADIHQATVKSVSDVTSTSSDDESDSNGTEKQQQQQHLEGKSHMWTGGTMFPVMPSGLKNPFNSSGSVSQSHGHTRSPSEEATHKLARNSILYESADLDESTTSLSDDSPSTATTTTTVTNMTTSANPPEKKPSSTLVQGGRGGRRWSHELSPEKAGLVGSVLEVAGLIKDVVLDKIQQQPPTSHDHRPTVSTNNKQVAAGVAFGGAEESGDQTILLDGLLNHGEQQRQKYDAERAAALDAAASTAPTPTTATEELLKAAPDAGKAHHKSIFHLAANPETKKSLLLEHPEALGYHGPGVKEQSIEDSTLAALGSQHRGQDVSKSGR
ncbi:hypothetical protein FBU30_008867 [Linnemannia zychae]|nr:hypothetical protein FBU30_008867 [Linnemannia zychae]